MPNGVKPESELESKRRALLSGPLRHIRSATLAASLVPVALIAATPVEVSAQCPSAGCPPSVPEPSALLLVGAGAAAVAVKRRLQK